MLLNIGLIAGPILERTDGERRVSPREGTRWLTARKMCYDFAWSCYASPRKQGKTWARILRRVIFAGPPIVDFRPIFAPRTK